jgi:transcriptional regulator with XRE-family HTH domain
MYIEIGSEVRMPGFMGNRLKDRRNELGMTQEQLADRVGIHKGRVSQYERNLIEPGAAILSKIAEQLNVSADYLLGLSDQPTGKLSPTALSPREWEVIRLLRDKRFDANEWLKIGVKISGDANN